MRKVILESPYSAPTAEGVAVHERYARACVGKSLALGEAPLASHLLYTQPGVLDDRDPAERVLGIAAGHAWLGSADSLVVYTDLGTSPGMQVGVKRAQEAGVRVEHRLIGLDWAADARFTTTFTASIPHDGDLQEHLVEVLEEGWASRALLGQTWRYEVLVLSAEGGESPVVQVTVDGLEPAVARRVLDAILLDCSDFPAAEVSFRAVIRESAS